MRAGDAEDAGDGEPDTSAELQRLQRAKPCLVPAVPCESCIPRPSVNCNSTCSAGDHRAEESVLLTHGAHTEVSTACTSMFVEPEQHAKGHKQAHEELMEQRRAVRSGVHARRAGR